MDKQNQKTAMIAKGLNALKRILTSETDIISVIKEDHEPLKDLIKVMKNPDLDFSQRLQAFKEFAPLLLTHAKAEEKALYDFMKQKSKLAVQAFEGDTEHAIADQLVLEIKTATEQNVVSAKIKVLAELVEHHIQEEESEMLPEIKKSVPASVLKKLTAKYIEVQEELISQGQEKDPREMAKEMQRH